MVWDWKQGEIRDDIPRSLGYAWQRWDLNTAWHQNCSRELSKCSSERTCLWDKRAYSSLGNGHRYQKTPAELLKVQVPGWLCSVSPVFPLLVLSWWPPVFKTSFFPTVENVPKCFHLRRKMAFSGSGCICSLFPFHFSFFSGSPLFLLLHSLPNSSHSALLKQP